ncbi:MAG TPA: hypothetical protein VF339_03855 [Gammaproteobacteria bacterium]
MTGRHDDEYEDTQVLPRKSDGEEPDLEKTVVLGEEYRRRIERGGAPERERDD